MTLEEALVEARTRWGNTVTVTEQRYIGYLNYTNCFVHDELLGHGCRASGNTWEEAFERADRLQLLAAMKITVDDFVLPGVTVTLDGVPEGDAKFMQCVLEVVKGEALSALEILNDLGPVEALLNPHVFSAEPDATERNARMLQDLDAKYGQKKEQVN